MFYLLGEFISEWVNCFSCFPELEFEDGNAIVWLRVRVFGVPSHFEQGEIVEGGLDQKNRK